MHACVVDASVLAAFAFGEPRAPEAGAMIADTRLYVPTLLAYELGNVALVKARRTPTREAAVEEALATVLAMRLTWEPTIPLQVFRLALDAGLSGYDASYLWVALRFGMPILTFDGRLAAAATRFGLA